MATASEFHSMRGSLNFDKRSSVVGKYYLFKTVTSSGKLVRVKLHAAFDVASSLCLGLLRPTVTDQRLWAPRGHPVFGPGVLAHGPLQLVAKIHSGVVSVGSHLFSRTNFKLKRAAALAELRQLLSA